MSAYYADEWLTVYAGDCRAVMASMEPESVHCVVTSPPYWGLRDYGVEGQIGLEPTPDEYVANLVDVFREVRRVLRSDGTVWLNLGDSYASGAGKVGEHPGGGAQGDHWKGAGHRGSRGGSAKQPHTGAAVGPMTQPNRMPIPGLKPKDRAMIPARAALALQADGWWLRDEIVWAKPNPMPSSVLDRTTPAHEMVYLLTRSARYWYDSAAIREPMAESSIQRINQPSFDAQTGGPKDYANGTNPNQSARKALENVAAKHRRTPAGWNVNHDKPNNVGRYEQRADKQAAAAAATPSGAASRRTMAGLNDRWNESEAAGEIEAGRNKRSVWTVAAAPYPEAHFATFPPKLIEPMILAGCPAGGMVLDPFAGTGTTGMVAQALSRRAVLIDLNADYLIQAMGRNRDIPLGLVG